MQKSRLSLSLATGLLAAAALTGCGGSGGGSDDSYTPPALQNGPGGTLLGFYAESEDANDPKREVGGIYVDAPDDTGRIKGRASFRYFDCQDNNSNNLKIDGSKLTSYLSGTIEGALDSTSTTNENNKEILLAFDKLSYSRADDKYSGGYVLDQDNNETRTLSDCNGIDQNFVINRKGTVTLYPADTVFPEDFDITQLNRIISWTNVPSSAEKVLVNVIDPAAIGDSTANGIVYQTVGTDLRLLTTAIPADAVTDSKEYIVLVQMFNDDNQPVAFKQIKTTF